MRIRDGRRSTALVFVSRQTARTGYILRHRFIVFVQPRDGPALIETRNNLGAMTSELKPSEFIEEFVSGGPKNYAYKTFHTMAGERKTVCKIRGITLNYSTSQFVNFEVIKDMVLDGTEMRHVTVGTEKKIKC